MLDYFLISECITLVFPTILILFWLVRAPFMLTDSTCLILLFTAGGACIESFFCEEFVTSTEEESARFLASCTQLIELFVPFMAATVAIRFCGKFAGLAFPGAFLDGRGTGVGRHTDSVPDGIYGSTLFDGFRKFLICQCLQRRTRKFVFAFLKFCELKATQNV
jgi:hypothetical protein